MRNYIKLNAIPIVIEIIFITSCFVIPRDYFIYTNFLFYLLLLAYFSIKKDFSLKEWINNINSGRKFWRQVLTTAFFFILAFMTTMILENIFTDFNTGTIALKKDGPLTLIIFAMSTILFPAVTEETFYRKNMISFSSKGILAVTTIISMNLQWMG